MTPAQGCPQAPPQGECPEVPPQGAGPEVAELRQQQHHAVAQSSKAPAFLAHLARLPATVQASQDPSAAF
eukprot:6463130-Amphidinium_carterae.1